jgi:phage-related protein
MRTFEFYRTETGRCPVEEFLDSLSGKEMQKIDWVMRVLAETPLVPAEYFEKLRGTTGIWALRARFGGVSLRILGFFSGANSIVLTNGFSKKTMKTPPSEIELAERRKKDH